MGIKIIKKVSVLKICVATGTLITSRRTSRSKRRRKGANTERKIFHPV